MMAYVIDYTDKAIADLIQLRDNEPKAYAKATALIKELMDHPQTGTGKPEQLKGERAGQWSRRITKKHRLIYTINGTEVTVLVLSAYGHYSDKQAPQATEYEVLNGGVTLPSLPTCPCSLAARQQGRLLHGT